jgi:hypothetical protein
LAIISYNHGHSTEDSSFSVSTRIDDGITEQDEVWTPSGGEIDLSLNKYVDVYSSEDLMMELPHETKSKLTKAIPWYDEFMESIRIGSITSLNRITHQTRLNFIKLKILYWKLASLYSGIYNHYWLPVVANERLEILNRNFPKGIIGYRALLSPNDPKTIRALVVKKAASNRHPPQIMSGNRGSLKIDDQPIVANNGSTEEPEDLSTAGPIEKYATCPDLKQVWNVYPRIHYVDMNRFVGDDMGKIESEAMASMASWTMAEVRSFLERLAVHGKNFKRISLSIPDKTERDCVEFYYRFKIHLNMKLIIAAGSQSRQERRKGGAESSAAASQIGVGNYKGIIDNIMEKLGADLTSIGGRDSTLVSSKSMEILNIRMMKDLPEKIEKPLDGDESPRRERRYAMIDIIGEAIARGQPMPAELGYFDSTSATPIASVAPPSRRPSLSMVKTETSVLASHLATVTFIQHAVITTAPSSPSSDRTLQSHHTV